MKIQSEKITVTYLAPKTRTDPAKQGWDALKEKWGIRERYILALSSFSPHKNIPALIRAFGEIAQESTQKVQLVLVGHIPAGDGAIQDLLQSSRLRDRIVFTGYLGDEELDLIYVHAAAFAFPSLYEGFGLPVLEAMSYGVPVACSKAASLPEVAGDAAVFFDPRSPAEMQSAIRRLLDDADLRDFLVQRGFQNLARFSWEKTAEETMRIYRAVCSASCA